MNYYTKRIDTHSELLLGRERSNSTIPNYNREYYYRPHAKHPDEQVNEHFGNISRIQYNHTHMITNSKSTAHHPKKEKKSLTVLRHSPQQQEEEEEDPSIPKISSKGGVKAPFPVKLMDLLNIVDDHPFDYDGTSLRSIISWQPDGKCFRVHDKVLFERHVQHRYFEQTNYTSFRRQLNLWGFKRIAGPKTGPNFGAYYHPQFLRDDKYSCRLMRRPSSIKNSNKKQNKKSSTTAAASVPRNNKKKSSSCKYPRSQSERGVVSPRYHPCNPTAVDHDDMQKRFSVPSSTNKNHSRRMSNTYDYTSSRRNPCHVLTSIEEACSYVQRWDEEMTVVADDDSSNSTTGIDTTRKLHDSFGEKIIRTLFVDTESEERSITKNEEEVFQLPDCEPIQEEEDVGVGSMEISLMPSEEIAYLLQIS